MEAQDDASVSLCAGWCFEGRLVWEAVLFSCHVKPCHTPPPIASQAACLSGSVDSTGRQRIKISGSVTVKLQLRQRACLSKRVISNMTSYSLSTELHLSSPIYRSTAKKHTAASVCTHTPTYPTPVRRRGDVIGLHIERDGLGMGTPRVEKS